MTGLIMTTLTPTTQVLSSRKLMRLVAVSVALAICITAQGQGRDISFLYNADASKFAPQTPPIPVFIEGGTLIDGTGAAPLQNPGILITGGIIQLGNTSPLPENTRLIDARGKWILPGMFDLHAHLTFYLPGGFHSESDVIASLRAERFLEHYQSIGVTTVCDVASRADTGYSMKHAQRMGLMKGSRLYVSGPGITVTGGHPTEFQPFEESQYGVESDGPWALRSSVREAVKKGADFIKVFPPLAAEEYQAVVDEAHAWKLRVTSHAGGIQDPSGTSTQRSVQAGVDSIHHLYPYGDNPDRTIAEMAKRSTYVIPTIGYHMREVSGNAHLSNTWMESNLGHNEENVRRNFRSLQEAGIKFGVGTESNPFDMLNIDEIYAQELEGFVRSGISPLQTIQSATLHSADAFGLAEQTGSIETGKWGDVIILSSDPLENIRALVEPELVIQGGEVVYRKER